MQRKLDTKRPEWIAWITAVCCGLVVHGFALMNVLHNYDDILQHPKGYGAGIESGRWLLHILGDFLQNVLELGCNLSVVNGVLYIFLIAVSAGFVVKLLEIRSKVRAGLIGALMVSFPTVTATMVFRFTAPYYGLSLLLAVVAVWVASKCKWGIVLSAVCIGASMGLYQAYVPVAIALFLLVLMKEALKEQAQLKDLILRGVYSCGCIILGVGIYFLCQKLALNYYPYLQNRILNEYQGIDTMGQIPLNLLPWLIKKAWLSGALFPLQNYCDLVEARALKIAWLLLLAVTAVFVCILVYERRKQPLNCAFFVLMLLFFPLAVNFVVVMAPEGIIYTIMVYGFVLMGCLPLMLAEYLPQSAKQDLLTRSAAILAAVVIFYNGYHANMNYTRLYYANEQVKNYFTGMTAQIRMTEGYTPDKAWAVVGDRIEDPNMWDIWNVVPVYGGFAGNNARALMNVSYSVRMWFDLYLGYGVNAASPEAVDALKTDPRVQQMPCWPSQGSLQVVDDFVVIKLQETTE